MIFPGHIAGGYLVTKLVIAVASAHRLAVPADQASTLIATGIIAGYLPDIDMVFYLLRSRFSTVPPKNQSHRNYITHAPLFWFAISFFVLGVGWIGSSAFTTLLGWILFAGTGSHFLFDSIEYGIMWLWPFSTRRFAFRKYLYQPEIIAPTGTIAHYLEEFTKVWNKRLTFVLEVLVVIAALLVFFHSN